MWTRSSRGWRVTGSRRVRSHPLAGAGTGRDRQADVSRVNPTGVSRVNPTGGPPVFSGKAGGSENEPDEKGCRCAPEQDRGAGAKMRKGIAEAQKMAP